MATVSVNPIVHLLRSGLVPVALEFDVVQNRLATTALGLADASFPA